MTGPPLDANAKPHATNMVGTILNTGAILLGGVAGLTLKRPLANETQRLLKLALGVLTVYVGLRMTWTSMGPGFGPVVKQFVIIVLAMTLGRITGRLLHLQKLSNRLGHQASEWIAQTARDRTNRISDGFMTCSILFCVGPFSILGSVQDGLGGHWEALAVKAAMDGLATMAFVPLFGWGVMLAVIPMLAYQGTITFGAKALEAFLQQHALLESINATSGLLVFCITLVIFEIRKVELADYLPSLTYAPLLAWWWKWT